MRKSCVQHILVIAAGILICGPAALAATYSSPPGTIQAGVNYFSLPAIASSTDPTVVFAGIPISGKLSYWCRMTQHWLVYPQDWSPPTMPWHMGYRLEADQDYTLTFQGNQSSTLRSTCLNPAQAGLAFISQPYDFEAFWGDFLFETHKNPGVKISTAQAVTNGWIEPYLIEGASDSGVHIELPGGTIKPWEGYWVTSKVNPSDNKLTIYWPTVPAPEPSALTLVGVGAATVLGRRRRSRRLGR